MSAGQPRFAAGDYVHLRSDRSRVGTITGAPQRANREFWYRVRFMDGTYHKVPEPDLAHFQAEVNPEDLFAENSFGNYDDFLRLVTFHKLNVPLDNTLYSLQSSRTEFFPHQYRPLIKLLDSKNQRLLIADEVGLGKTIEAGLILAELRARRSLRQVLVVCPKALCLKWKEEMWRRFDEEFTIFNSRELRDLLGQLQERGEIGELRAIIPLQALRREELIDLLEATPIPLDLAIFDEAHHLRNPETLSNRVAHVLTEAAAAVLLLTATPVHLGNHNLFHLLRILDAQEFEDLNTFEQRLHANVPVVEAERLLRSSFPPPLDRVRDRLHRLGRGTPAIYFARNPLYQRIRAELDEAGELSRSDVARIQHDLKDLNLLGHVFTRTRKREVFASSALRSAYTVAAPMTSQEARFYDLVTEFARAEAQDAAGIIHNFAPIMAQRQVASCMSAARARFMTRALQRIGDTEEVDDLDSFLTDEGEEHEERVSLPQRVIEAGRALGDTDSKFDKLLETLRELDGSEPGRKILLFSYFRDTLGYLHERLTAAGYRCEVITGLVESNPRDPERDERYQRMQRFKDPASGVRLLLSSEVGSEGLDFQFCHILINYDLPWNPMLVEQRIGRLDRLGQLSDRILIFNLTLPDTIEDRILERLYMRIGIFERSIGDLEEILGDEITRLTRDLLSSQLTPEQEAARIDQAAQAIEQRKLTLDQLEAEVARFVSSDSYFEEQLERARRGGELLAPADLETFFRAFLTTRYPEGRLRAMPRMAVYALEIDDKLEAALRQQPGGAPKFRLLHRLARGNGSVLVTFTSEAAFNDDAVEFLAAHHPLMQLATEHYQRNREEIHAASALRVPGSDGLEPGLYAYGLFEVTIEAGRMRKRLEPLFLSLHDGSVVPEAASSALLGQMLRAGDGWRDVPPLNSEAAHALMQQVDSHFLERISRWREEQETRSVAVAETRLASLDAAFQARRARKKELLYRAHELGRQERYIRMLEGTIRNMTADYEQRRRELEAEKTVTMTYTMFGCGLLALEPPR